jgi:ribosomal protein S18 acetylase RimI-like enzyme
MLEIRKANTEDAIVISLLGRVTFTETFAHLFRDKNDLLKYFDRTFSVEKIEKGLGNPNDIFWIAFYDRLPVGYAKLKLNSRSEFSSSENICQLQKIYVLRDFLSMGIGYALLVKVIQEAREKFFDEIWLSVLNINHRAVNFYQGSNFKIVGSHPFQIGKESFDFYVMLKNLNEV